MSNRALYIILEIQPDAAPEEIKRAYHRLALQYHPDRAGPESAEKFQQILAAYTLLKDPEAREVYDRYGEQGLSNMETVPAMAEAAQHMDKVSFFRLMFGMGTLICIVTIIFFAILAVKLDGRTDYSWYAILIPGYILVFFAMASVVISVVFRLRKYRHLYRATYAELGKDAEAGCTQMPEMNEDASQTQTDGLEPSQPTLARQVLKSLSFAVVVREIQFWIGHLLIVNVSISLLMMAIAFAQRENPEADPIGWWSVFIPAIAGNFVSFASVPVLRSILRVRGIHDISTPFIVFLNILSFIIAVLRTVQIVIILLTFQGILDWRAEYWLIPAELYFFFSFVSEASIAILRTRSLRKLNREAEYMSDTERVAKQEKYRSDVHFLWAEITFWFFVNLLAILGLTLSARASSYGYTKAFVPFFILFGSLLVLNLFLFTCFTIFIETEESEKKRRQQREGDEDSSEERADESEDDSGRGEVSNDGNDDARRECGAHATHMKAAIPTSCSDPNIPTT